MADEQTQTLGYNPSTGTYQLGLTSSYDPSTIQHAEGAPQQLPAAPAHDVQLIHYIDPSQAVLDALPIGPDFSGARSDMTFEGEIGMAAFPGETETPASSAVSSAVRAGSLAPSVGLNPWLIIAIVIVAVLVFGQEN